MSTSYRHWLLLRMIPRHPRKIDSASIAELLDRQGIAIHRRTIQRDLEKLSDIFPLSCDDRDKPYGWSWSKDVHSFDIPALSPSVALVYRMAGDYLSNMLPHEILTQLGPHVRQADTVLGQTDKETLRAWPDKVRTISRSQPLQPPRISPEVFAVVSGCLLEGKRFTVSYLRRGEGELVVWTINPLGLVLHDRLITLVCTVGSYCQVKDVIKLHLHRMVEAQQLDEQAAIPAGFSLDDYITSGSFGFRKSERAIRLKALFESDATIHLAETPLSDDQKLIDQGNSTVQLEATVQDTGQLRWWLLGFGGRVEVLEPEALRQEMRGHAEKMVRVYG